MPSPARDSRSNDDLIRANRGFYESLWADAHLMEPQRFNTWPLVRELVATAPRRLEVAPGLRPRLPLEDTCFIDLSHAALRQLRARGANTAHGMIGALPCASASFDLVCALDILEHVADDEGALRELARVAAPGATVLLSVPLHQHAWTAFDEFVGHCRRYEPDRIMTLLAQHGFSVAESLGFSALTTIGAVPGALLAWPVTDRFGRKVPIVVVSLATAASGLAYGLTFNPVAIVVFGFCVNLLIQTFATLLYTYSPELFPTALRNAGHGLVYGTGRLANIFGPMIVASIFSAM